MDRKMKIYRDSSGNLINIGEWDYAIFNGIETNPLPDGAAIEEADVVTGYDGGLYLSDDPRASNL
tara:strand:- start:21 stop:215 length:195 start_codon:yes stop_codon:yes gene_type:complete